MNKVSPHIACLAALFAALATDVSPDMLLHPLLWLGQPLLAPPLLALRWIVDAHASDFATVQLVVAYVLGVVGVLLRESVWFWAAAFVAVVVTELLLFSWLCSLCLSAPLPPYAGPALRLLPPASGVLALLAVLPTSPAGE